MASKKHSVEVVKPQIPIDEHLDLHEKGWIVQRAGWVFMLLVMLLTALGLFGEGVLSKQSPVAGSIKAEYDRFFRYEAEMKVLVESSGEHISRISLPQSYLKHFRIVRMVPEPFENKATSDQIEYSFQGDQNKIVSIYLVPKDFGSINGTLVVNNSNFLLNHFIYP